MSTTTFALLMMAAGAWLCLLGGWWLGGWWLKRCEKRRHPLRKVEEAPSGWPPLSSVYRWEYRASCDCRLNSRQFQQISVVFQLARKCWCPVCGQPIDKIVKTPAPESILAPPQIVG